MLHKLCLIIKNSADNILVTKTSNDNVWKLPYLYKSNPNAKLINSILEITNNCGVENITTITYKFETTKRTVGLNMLTTSYYELITQERYLTRPCNSFFSLMRYIQIEHLKILFNTSPAIKKYITLTY